MDDSWGDEDVSGVDLEFDDEFGASQYYVSDLDLSRQRAREEFLKKIRGGIDYDDDEQSDEEFDTCPEPQDLWSQQPQTQPQPQPPPQPQPQPQPQPYVSVCDYRARPAPRIYYTLTEDLEFSEDDLCGSGDWSDEDKTADKECHVSITRGGKMVTTGGKITSQAGVDEARECQNDFIVEDQYYPGLIDDAVHKKVDFYQTCFDISYGEEIPVDAPENPPLSLVEAFEMRVAREQGARKKIMKETPGPKESAVPVKSEKSSFIGFLKDQRRINRDEVKLANAVDVELATIVQNKPVNELTKAINCLQKAQIMNEYDKSLQAAEEAYQSAPPELAETAAVQKATNFVTEQLTKKEAIVSSSLKSYRPIEIVSYVGITKPILEEPELAASRNK